MAIQNKKIAITTTNTKPAVGKLLIVLIKMALIKNRWDINIKQI